MTFYQQQTEKWMNSQTFRQLEKANRQMKSKQTDGQLNGFSEINSDESWNVTRNACYH